jgi:ferrochelatase
MTAAKYDAVLLVAFGGPERMEDVRPFLENVLRGRPVPQARFDEVVHHYEVLGGRSPINEITAAQTSALSRELLSWKRSCESAAF